MEIKVVYKSEDFVESKNRDTMLPISETLFIPLAVRAIESTRDKAIISDQKSAEIFREINTAHMIIDGGEIATHGILARTKVIDEEVSNILAKDPNATIINLGAGLDTRISRIDNGCLKWYDLDLPEVIMIRKKFFSENERIRFISRSVLDSIWMQEVNVSKDSRVIIIAEGLLMYFSEKEVTEILALLATNFPEAHMFFDVVHSYFINKKISSSFLWGIDKAKEIEKLSLHVKVLQAWSAGNLLKDRQSTIFRILNFLPATRKRSQILHIQFK